MLVHCLPIRLQMMYVQEDVLRISSYRFWWAANRGQAVVTSSLGERYQPGWTTFERN